MTDIEDTLNKIWTGQEQLAETLKQLEIGQAQQQREASMPEPVRVFVSYAHQDHVFAKRLVGDLQKAGAEV